MQSERAALETRDAEDKRALIYAAHALAEWLHRRHGLIMGRVEEMELEQELRHLFRAH